MRAWRISRRKKIHSTAAAARPAARLFVAE
jgi:hypothetical protein